MEATIGLFELVGGMIFFFAAGLLFARISSYGKYYDKMLYDEESDTYIVIKKINKENDDDNHYSSILHKKTNLKWKQKKLLLVSIILCTIIPMSKAEENSQIKVTADVVSSYVWRGILSTAKSTPNFQPSLSYCYKGLELGTWASTDFIGSYKEIDLYISYSKSLFKVTLTDYNWNFKTPYFNFKNKETDHILEGTLAYNGVGSFPFTVSVATMFYGADKTYENSYQYTDTNGNTVIGGQNPDKQNYSTYIELSYPVKSISFFLGFTPSDGYYGDSYGNRSGFSLVNLGLSGNRSINITDKFSLPVKATLGFNPQKEDAYLVFTLTL